MGKRLIRRSRYAHMLIGVAVVCLGAACDHDTSRQSGGGSTSASSAPARTTSERPPQTAHHHRVRTNEAISLVLNHVDSLENCTEAVVRTRAFPHHNGPWYVRVVLDQKSGPNRAAGWWVGEREDPPVADNPYAARVEHRGC